jgi:hypothetical protein
MYEFHGWVTLRVGADDDLRSDATLFTWLEKLVESLNGGNRTIEIAWNNGDCFLWMQGSHNHKDPAFEELFIAIAPKAPGSYGLLYVWDDEDPESYNEFRVFRMAHGSVTIEKDPFLSPCIPVIERESDS